MKNEQIQEFFTKVAQDESFKAEVLKFKEEMEAKKLNEQDVQKFVGKVLLPKAKKLGYDFSEKDLADFGNSQGMTNLDKLSPEDLENVSGGVLTWLFNVIAGVFTLMAGGDPGAAPPPVPPGPAVVEHRAAGAAEGLPELPEIEATGDDEDLSELPEKKAKLMDEAKAAGDYVKQLRERIHRAEGTRALYDGSTRDAIASAKEEQREMNAWNALVTRATVRLNRLPAILGNRAALDALIQNRTAPANLVRWQNLVRECELALDGHLRELDSVEGILHSMLSHIGNVPDFVRDVNSRRYSIRVGLRSSSRRGPKKIEFGDLFEGLSDAREQLGSYTTRLRDLLGADDDVGIVKGARDLFDDYTYDRSHSLEQRDSKATAFADQRTYAIRQNAVLQQAVDDLNDAKQRLEAAVAEQQTTFDELLVVDQREFERTKREINRKYAKDMKELNEHFQEKQRELEILRGVSADERSSTHENNMIELTQELEDLRQEMEDKIKSHDREIQVLETAHRRVVDELHQNYGPQ